MHLAELTRQHVGFCASGGLDSRTLTKKFVELGVKVTCFTADLGQPDELDIAQVKARMTACGAETVLVDLKAPMAEACFEVLQALAMYDGGYWNSTGIARSVTVKGLLPVMQQHGCGVLAHGATGRGNDQMRFERYTNVLAPAMKVYAPWRDPELLKEFSGRTQMAAYLVRFGLPVPPGTHKQYSTDANLAGLSHEAEDLESMETAMTIVQPTMGVWPAAAPDKAETVTLRFEHGRCVAINGQLVTPLAAMQTANHLAGRNGIGLKHALENRIIGTKSRGVYEAPGMELLGAGLRYIYQAVMDRRSTLLFQQLSKLVADQIYDGRYFDPVTRAAQAAIAIWAVNATATVQLEMYKGNLHFLSLTDCRASLYNEADSSMEASDGLNPVSSQGFAEIQSVEALALARAGQIRA